MSTSGGDIKRSDSRNRVPIAKANIGTVFVADLISIEEKTKLGFGWDATALGTSVCVQIVV